MNVISISSREARRGAHLNPFLEAGIMRCLVIFFNAHFVSVLVRLVFKRFTGCGISISGARSVIKIIFVPNICGISNWLNRFVIMVKFIGYNLSFFQGI